MPPGSRGGAGGGGASFSDLVGGLTGIFGSSGSQSQSGSGTSTSKGTITEKLNIDQEGIQKILQDVLGGADGLADIFSAESVSGLYNSTAAVQAAGDLASKLVGEIAKLTAESVTTKDETVTSESKSKTKSKDGGLLGGIKGLFG